MASAAIGAGIALSGASRRNGKTTEPQQYRHRSSETGSSAGHAGSKSVKWRVSDTVRCIGGYVGPPGGVRTWRSGAGQRPKYSAPQASPRQNHSHFTPKILFAYLCIHSYT